MNVETIVNSIVNKSINLSTNSECISYLKLNQHDLIEVIHFCLQSDTYLNITKKLWDIIEEDEDELKKYELYAYLLSQEFFSNKTARFICLKERKLKHLGNNLLSKCGSVKAIKFIIEVYGFDNNNIIDAITCCVKYESVHIMDYLLSLIKKSQQEIALNRLMTAFIKDVELELSVGKGSGIELEVVKHLIKIQKDWSPKILENETVKSILLFNKINNKLKVEKKNKYAAIKI